MTVIAIDRSRPSAAFETLPTRGGEAAFSPFAVRGIQRRGTAVLLSSMLLPFQARSELLQPLAALTYRRQTRDGGAFVLRIGLLNRAQYTAHEPFLCLPDRGFHLAPAPGWNFAEVAPAAKLRRFAPARPTALKTSERMHCCDIWLPFDTRGDGRLAYEPGNRHAIDNLPDLTLSCVAGAGNYPSERLQLIVPANAFRSYIASLVAAGDIPGFTAVE